MPGQPLPDSAIDRLLVHAVPEDELRAMRVVTSVPGRWLPPLFRAGAMTFGRTVLFRAGRYDSESPRGLALIAHEAGHITQWSDLGWVRFLLEYGRGQVMTGFSHARHPLERPLNDRQRVVRAALEAE
jgi:Domain of unknown function (DUF4157)